MSTSTADFVRLDTPPDYPRVGIRLTVADFLKLVDDGVVPEEEGWELLDGQIVYKDRSAPGEDPMSVGTRHGYVQSKLVKLDRVLEPLGCHIRIGCAVSLPPYNMPQPDGAIVRGVPEDYLAVHPTAADLLCVIEISHSSLRRDVTTKMRTYAGTGVAMYVILNVAERRAEVYRDPLPAAGRYGRSETLTAEGVLSLPTAAGEAVQVPVGDLLPSL